MKLPHRQFLHLAAVLRPSRPCLALKRSQAIKPAAVRF